VPNYIDFPSSSYQLVLDPSSYFSILFVGEQFVNSELHVDQIKTLNYTYISDELYTC
jgi:hypothetical protein